MQKKQNFYITTPIYYGNGLPHIGHFYSSSIANIIHNFFKIYGYNSKFTTGIDENSQKAVLKAQEAKMEIMDYLDEMATKHKEVWDFFALDYNDFIRTTEKRHHNLVREVLQTCFDAGDIYEGIYEGMYCIGCEAFKKEEDLIEKDGKKVCSDHLKEPEYLKEKNYFFKLSKYQTWIEEFYKENPNFVKPDFRYNEVKAFVSRGLEDFSISRETNTFGIPLPFDNKQVTYVWFDALFNYYTSCRYSPKNFSNGEKTNIDGKDFYNESEEFWIKNPNKVHIVGKDIIRFHAIFWPCMLASYFGLGEKIDGVLHYKKGDEKYIPTTILTGGYFTVDGQKMSKSLGNVIEPVKYAGEYGKDLLILYMLSAFPIGLDGDYDRKQAILIYNAKLANNLGNLLNRVVVLSLKLGEKLEITKLRRYSGISMEGDTGVYDDKYFSLEADNILEKTDTLKNQINEDYKRFNLKGVLDESFKFLDMLNKFADEKEPWKTIKDETKLQETREILYTLAEGLRQVGLGLFPFFPEKMSEMFNNLGLKNYSDLLKNGNLIQLQNKKEIFEITQKSQPLFPRFEIE